MKVKREGKKETDEKNIERQNKKNKERKRDMKR